MQPTEEIHHPPLRIPAEVMYVLGILLMALGVSLVSRSVFGYSMIVAPAYLIWAKSGILTFGTIEYLWQGVQLLVMCLIVRRFRVGYLFSFVTAVLYGLLFDGCLWLTSHIPAEHLASRAALFALGTLLISTAVACSVRTYLAPTVYELFVKEVSSRYGFRFGRVKSVYDLGNLSISLILAVAMFGWGVFSHFSFPALWEAILDGYVLEGIGIGTLIATLVNGPCIGFVGKMIDKYVRTTPLFPKLASFMNRISA